MQAQTHGVPTPQRWAVTATGGEYALKSNAIFLQISPLSTNAVPIRIYFTEAAFDADVGTPALTGIGEEVLELGPDDFFSGPVHAVNSIWMRGVAGTATATVLSYATRG